MPTVKKAIPALPSANVFGLEVFRAGKYPQGDYGKPVLKEMVESYDPNFLLAPVTLDHVGQGPAYGWVTGIRLGPNGDSIIADLYLSPELLQDIQSHRYRTRSIEVRKLDELNGKNYFVGLTFLGAATPAVKGMSDAALVAFSARKAPKQIGKSVTIQFACGGNNSVKKKNFNAFAGMRKAFEDAIVAVEEAEKQMMEGEEMKPEDQMNEMKPEDKAAMQSGYTEEEKTAMEMKPEDKAAMEDGMNETVKKLMEENERLKAEMSGLVESMKKNEENAQMKAFSEVVENHIKRGAVTAAEKPALLAQFAAVAGVRDANGQPLRKLMIDGLNARQTYHFAAKPKSGAEKANPNTTFSDGINELGISHSSLAVAEKARQIAKEEGISIDKAVIAASRILNAR